MSNNPVVSNNYVSTNPDYRVSTREVTGGLQVQQFQLDIGTGSDLSPVTLANPLPVTISGSASSTATATETNVNVTTSSSTILASNASRVSGWLMNISDTTIYVSFGATATTSKIPVFQYGTLPISVNGVNYTGAVNAIHAGTGSKSVFIQWC
jgi:hypothetical protein